MPCTCAPSESPSEAYHEDDLKYKSPADCSIYTIKSDVCLSLQELVTEMIKANPKYKPPADYRPEKKYRKLRIPLDEYPGYNFIGLIIGPRGNTQKRMERVRQLCVLRCAARSQWVW
jgi:hypothetical protein